MRPCLKTSDCQAIELRFWLATNRRIGRPRTWGFGQRVDLRMLDGAWVVAVESPMMMGPYDPEPDVQSYCAGKGASAVMVTLSGSENCPTLTHVFWTL